MQHPFKERTIGFFEVVALRDGGHVRVSQIDFQHILRNLARATVARRKWEGDDTFVGTTMNEGRANHLLLHRVKSSGEWLSVIDFNTGDLRELESQAHRGYLETSAMSFAPYGNIVGIMQGSISSPSHRSLENWMNHLKILKEPIAVRALTSHAEVERLKTAAGASRVDIRIGSSNMAALSEKTGRLASFLRRASVDYGDARVTLTISIPRGRGRDSERERLLADLQDLGDAMPHAAEIAKARLIYAESGSAEESRIAEFVEHHITAKSRVRAVDAEGNSIRLSAALGTIMDTMLVLEQELKLAVDVLA
ncbi:MAG: hypothetical protein QG671_4290 [Actinomycetota bacterium]|nr:hypothetical protein [Actinomycetota bacterium]